ncbi:MAG: oxygen-independent coproporphyrinogen III oxidase [Oleibacter sp.]|nr:oxygen-independent coproporphyrinogen III oxidase [Thalassolituus sp.]
MNFEDIKPLIEKYQGRGPRYTSYPTALQFTDKFTDVDYQEHVFASNQQPVPRPLSLYFHIPFCQSLCYYCGCNKVVTHKMSQVEHYMDHLYQEIEMQSNLYDGDRFVEQIHLGGGTPTYLSSEMLEEMMEVVAQSFHLGLPSKLQMAIEIDPRTVNAQRAAELVGIGFNRVSLGVQDLDPVVQKAINREQSFEEISDIVSATRDAGGDSVSFDLLYGLPHQTLPRFQQTLERVLTLKPDRIALYNYAHMPDKIASQRLIETSALPSASAKIELFLLAHRELDAAGYVYLGMDHFALPTDPLAIAFRNNTMQRNFQGYSTHAGCDLVGMGVSAISHVNGCYSQNSTSIKAYSESISHNRLPVARGFSLTHDDMIRADVIQRLMCQGSIHPVEISRTYDIIFEQYFYSELDILKGFVSDGILTVQDNGWQVTDIGRYFLRSIAMVFDASLPKVQQPNVALLVSQQSAYSNLL